MKKLQFARLVMAGALLGGATMVHADTLAGVGWGLGQASVVCYLFNAGPGGVSITSTAIFAANGITYPLTNACGIALAPGQTCYFLATVPATGSNACYAVLSPSAAGVRGEIEIRNAAGVVVNSGALR